MIIKKRRGEKSATLRLFWMHLGASIISAALTLGVVYFGATKLLESQTASVVEAELSGLVDDFANGGQAALRSAIIRRTNDLENTDSIYLYATSRGVPIAGNLSNWPVVPMNGKWTQVELHRADINKTVAVGGRAFALQGGGRLFVGRDLRERREFRVLLEYAGAALLLFFLLSGTFGGLAVSRTILKRMRGLQEVSMAVEQGDLSRRSPVLGSEDEIDRLAQSMNAMLDKNENLVAELRMVTDSLAHDLRTPLAHLRNNLQAVAEGGLGDNKEKILSEAISEAEYIHKVFTELLDIARADAGLAAEQFETISLSQILYDIVELYEPLAENKNLQLATNIDRAVKIYGHGQFIARAVANLLDNAIKFTPPGGVITVSLVNNMNAATLSVADSGPGLADSQWEQALSRFGKVDIERSGRGAGLGLSLVASVAKLHGAALFKGDSNVGLDVTIAFPVTGERRMR